MSLRRRERNCGVLRPALSPKCDNIQPSTQSPYQADCFTPKRMLRRTPPKKTPSTANARHQSAPRDKARTSQKIKSPLTTLNTSSNHEATNRTPTSTPKRDTTKQTNARRSLHGSEKRARGTNSKKPGPSSAMMTPTRREVQVGKDQQNQSGKNNVQAPCFTPSRSLKRSPPSTPEELIDAAPPRTHWELPRTPQRSPVHIHQVQVDPVRSTRKIPSVHPLSRSTRATPPRHTPSKSTFQSDDMTEDDRAFLQEMKYTRQQKELQDKSNQLEKALKTTAQQKELLQHEALKIDRDIEDMRSKYQETLTNVHSLIANSSFSTHNSTTTDEVSRTMDLEKDGLTHDHVAQLRKLNQLTSAQLVKTGHELKGRLLEVGRKREELEYQTRECEEQQKAELFEMESKIQSTQAERTELEKTVKRTSEEHASVQAHIQELQSTLETLSLEKVNKKESQPSSSSSQLEKERVEKRLQRLIRRCELYVKRHEMLKEMGIR